MPLAITPRSLTILLTLLLLRCSTAHGIQFGYIHTKQSLLSGDLGACDPLPNSTSCVGGLVSVTAYARQAVLNGSASFVIVVPQLDISSAFSSMHPDSKGVNLDVYRRIHNQLHLNSTGVVLDNYVSESSIMASSKVSLRTLLDYAVTPLASTIVPPSTSSWWGRTTPVHFVNISSGATLGKADLDDVVRGRVATPPVLSLLHVDDMSRVWTASTVISPSTAAGSSSGYAAVADTSAASIIGTCIMAARQVSGLVFLTSDDVAVTPTKLLSDILQYELLYVATHSDEDVSWVPNLLPDVFLFQSGSAQVDFNATLITASYTMSNGTVLNGSRVVLLGHMSSSDSGFVTLDVDETALQAAVNLPRSQTNMTAVIRSAKVRDFDPSTIPTSAKDPLYYEDQAFLLNLSRVASSYDPVVGRTLVPMPPAYVGPTVYTCYAGECGQASLVSRALLWHFDSDMAFMDSGSVRGDGWGAGDVHMSYLFAMFPFAEDVPCYGTILGLRVLEIFTYSLSVTAFTTAFTSSGIDLLQAAGVRIEYVLQNNTANGVGAKITAFSVYNKTTGVYEPLERLKYYTFASNDYLCAIHGVYSSFFSAGNAYRGESTNPYAGTETLTLIVADFLTAKNPYTPILSNYYTAHPLSSVESGAVSYLTYSTSSTSCNSYQWYDAGVASCIDCPSGWQRSNIDVTTCIPIPVASSTNNTPLIIGVAVGGGLLLLLVLGLGVFMEVRRRGNSRSNANAPRGDTDVAILFTDIKSSTKLWGAAPLSVGVALDMHHATVRKSIATFGGYEVKTVGDSFMIAVDNAQRAVEMAVDIQHALHNQAWPSAINEVYAHVDDEFENLDDNPDDVTHPVPGVLWNGIRVRIGIHYGPVEVVLDEVTKGYDYYGPTVNVAARVEGVTDGGQVCISEAAAKAVNSAHMNYQLTLLGKTQLRGVKDEVVLFTVLPTGLEGRVFERRLVETTIGLNLDSDTVSVVSLKPFVPLNANTLTIRDTICEALKALRGDDRVAVIERLRKAWRVELPGGRKFTGSKHPPVAIAMEISRRDSSSSIHTARQSAQQSMQTTKHSTQPTAEETDEDIVFRVVAQRLAPGSSSPPSRISSWIEPTWFEPNRNRSSHSVAAVAATKGRTAL